MESEKKIKKLSWLKIADLVKTTFVEFFAEQSFFHGAALAYYTIFALVPIMYLTLISFGQIVGQETVLTIIDNLLKEQVGLSDSSEIMGFVQEFDFEKGSWVMNVVGIFALILSSSALFDSLRHSINEFLDIVVKIEDRRKRILHNLGTRFVTIIFLPIFGVIIMVTYFVEPIILNFGHKLFDNLNYIDVVIFFVLEHALSLVTNFLLFTMIFKYLHDGNVRWKLAFSGGLVTSILLYLGQLVIHYYLNNYFFASGMGVPGALLVLLLWMYYSSQIIFLGAKFVKVYATEVGEPVVFTTRSIRRKKPESVEKKADSKKSE